MNTMIRILIAVLGAAALAAVAALWFNPDGSVQTFGLTLNGGVGHATVRADLAFLALGIFSLLCDGRQQQRTRADRDASFRSSSRLDNGANYDKPLSVVGSGARYIEAPNRTISAGGITFAYRDVGPQGGVPLILLNHWGAVLDNFDPPIIDGLAGKHRVIATNYRGIGASSGVAPVTVDEMARDTIGLIKAFGFERVDLFGFSLGGFVAQDVTLKVPVSCGN
jgi:hypothetical protein